MIFKRFIISVPANKLKFSFIKSSGPGGQNVNKTNSKAKMFVDLSGEWVDSDIKKYLKTKHPSKVNSNGSQLMIQSDSHRSQHQNQQSCTQKLDLILSEAEKACQSPVQPSLDQIKRVQGLKDKFNAGRREEKSGKADIKRSRKLKNNWRSFD